jgi:hypothetical protein
MNAYESEPKALIETKYESDVLDTFESNGMDKMKYESNSVEQIERLSNEEKHESKEYLRK